ncbi:MAG: hypothetical protein CMJ18_10680 [Phycisphaeraceae bacterium]|nr:hypothetical protein [Phycisphaeraceae bacterium]
MSTLIAELSMAATSSEPVVLVREGRPESTIVISAAPGYSVQLAAFELQHYVRKISGATIPIVREPAGVEGTRILVGAGQATEGLGLANRDFRQREHLIETRPGMLILMGLDTTTGSDRELGYDGDLSVMTEHHFAPLGSCHAVHTFLERLGVRWYLPTELGEVVPEKKTIEVAPVRIRRMTHASDFGRNQFGINRQLYLNEYEYKVPGTLELSTLDYDEHFDLRSGVLYWIRQKKWGCEPFRSNHSFHGWEFAFGRDHPEWFSTKSWEKMEKLIREPEGFQTKINPVLSNEGLIRKKVEVVRAYFDGKPPPFTDAYYSAAGNSFGVCLNDNGYWSEDPECVKQYEPDMGHAGKVSRYFWTFVNRVAREVRKTHPNGEIIGLAYWSYTLPPREPFRLEPNVSVMLCKFPIIYWHREHRDHDYEQIETWIRYGAKHVYTWEYLIWPSIARSFPSILPRTYAEDAKWLASHPQFKGGYMQMYGFGIESADGQRRAGLMWENPINYFFNAYFRWKLYDDPLRDIDRMLDEFFEGFYGPAAAPARRFVEAMEDRWNDRPMREASGFGTPEADLPMELYWEHMGDEATVERLERLMAETRAAAPEGSIYAKRVVLLDNGVLGHLKLKRKQHFEAK